MVLSESMFDTPFELPNIAAAINASVDSKPMTRHCPLDHSSPNSPFTFYVHKAQHTSKEYCALKVANIFPHS